MDPSDVFGLMEEYQRDPVRWAREVLGVHLWSEQEEILRSLVTHDVVAVRSCHSIGKSFIASVAVLWFMANHYPAKVITTAPTNRQVEGVLWSEVRTLFRKALVPLGGDMKLRRWDLGSDWYALGFAPRDYDEDAVQGFHGAHVLVVVDEASGVGEVVFTGFKALLEGAHTRMLMIGNPTNGLGSFGKAFKASSDTTAKHVVSAFNTPNFTAFGVTLQDVRSGAWKKKVGASPMPFPTLTTPKDVRAKWDDWCNGTEAGEDNPLWQSRVMAQFPVLTDDMLIPLEWIEAAQERWVERDAKDAWEGPSTYGVDIARFGPDSSVIAAHHKGQGVRQLHKRTKSPIPATVGWVLFNGKKEDVGVVQYRVDEDGMGGGAVDMLREELGHEAVVGIRGGLPAKNPDRFVNLRSEMYWRLREALDPSRDAKEALPPDSTLAAQLSNIKFGYDPKKGRIWVETKDQMRARKLKSPDEADAVVYAGADLEPPEIVPIIDPEDGRADNYWARS